MAEQSISCVETDKIIEKRDMICRQTDYSVEVAEQKLKEHQYDEVQVIREYMGLPPLKKETKSNVISKTGIQQEIFRQIRHQLDSNMREYHERVDRGEARSI